MTIKCFIERPLLSTVINVIVVAMGILALTRLPIEKYPDIAPPTVYLWASYPGASAEAVQKSVVAPLEQAINGVDNMSYMKSSASNGSASISSIDISGSVAQGSSTGDAIRAIREVAANTLPEGYGIEFSGITREESQTGSNVVFIFLICVFFVYLIMVALYESLFIPMAVILGVPFGLMGALLFAQLFGVQNNIYLQVGLIMLIGLLCKAVISGEL